MTNYVFHQETPMQNVEEMTQITMPMAYGGEVKPPKMLEGGNINFNLPPEYLEELMTQANANNSAPAAVTSATANNSSYERSYPAPTKQYGKGMVSWERDIIDSEYQRDLAHWNENKTLFESGQPLKQQDNFPRYVDYQRKGQGNNPAFAAQVRNTYERDTENYYAAVDAAAETQAANAAAEAAANDPDRLAAFAERFAGGELTPEEIQSLIDGGMSEQDVLTLIGNYELTENQLGQLFTQGLLTEEQIAGLIQEEISVADEQRAENNNVDMSGYATKEDLAGLETLFQNSLTPEQLEGYMTSEQYDQAAAGDQEVIQSLTDQIDALEQKYQDVTSQYEADAVNQQISDTKEELGSFFARSVPSGPRTGSTSQFSSGTSFLPGGSPMANLIGSQREGAGQDAFNSYLSTFTPSYSAYDEPFSVEEYSDRSQPFTGGMYNNPFTGGMSYKADNMNMGGPTSNGIMDLTNFDTNVQPFQNAFRPNVPRN